MGIIAFIIFGALIGWLAGKFTRGTGFGLIGNIAVGIVGSLIGRLGFSLIGIAAENWIGKGICAFLGSILLLYLIGRFRPNVKK